VTTDRAPDAPLAEVEWRVDQLPDRFRSKFVVHVAGCWEWTAAITDTGYGIYYVGRNAEGRKVNVRAHRFAYEALVAPIPEGLQLDHLCRNRACINPAHLEPVTQIENIRRGEGMGAKWARRTHCDNGHPLSGANLGTSKYRRCLACHREKERARRSARRAS